jgi:hypothetical protein
MRKPNTVAQLYGLPHGILHVFNTILYENEFLNPQIFQQTISLFPEQSTLLWHLKVTLIILIIFSRLRGFWVLVLSIKDPFWVLANAKTQKVTLIILIIFSHLCAKFLGFWVFGF